MANYYLKETLENLQEESYKTDAEALQSVKDYFTNNFTPDELLELLIRGQIHAEEDKRTNSYYSK